MTEMGFWDPQQAAPAQGSAAARAAALVQRKAKRSGQTPRLVYGVVTAADSTALTLTVTINGGAVTGVKMADRGIAPVGSTIALMQTDGTYLGVGTIDGPQLQRGNNTALTDGNGRGRINFPTPFRVAPVPFAVGGNLESITMVEGGGGSPTSDVNGFYFYAYSQAGAILANAGVRVLWMAMA